MKPYVTTTFGGRTATETALSKKGKDRDYRLAEQLGGWRYSQFDIKAEVPSVFYLLFRGKWVGTDPAIHLRKDVMKKIGVIERTQDDKNCTFRWLFEPTLTKATANFRSALEGRDGKDHDFSLGLDQFILGWCRMQNILFGTDSDKWDKNVVADWKDAIWWWTGRLEETTKQLLQKDNYKVCNAYDCFYSDADVDVIKQSIDEAAGIVLQEFIDEKKAFIEKWGSYSPYERYRSGRKKTTSSLGLSIPSGPGVIGGGVTCGLSLSMAHRHSTTDDTHTNRPQGGGTQPHPITIGGVTYTTRQEACEVLNISMRTLLRRIKKEKGGK
jgi:hypothetical protein